jgi:hypothetical protein
MGRTSGIEGKMNNFDDIPEDRELSFPCDSLGCPGNVTQEEEIPYFWVCDTCGKVYGDIQ